MAKPTMVRTVEMQASHGRRTLRVYMHRKSFMPGEPKTRPQVSIPYCAHHVISTTYRDARMHTNPIRVATELARALGAGSCHFQGTKTAVSRPPTTPGRIRSELQACMPDPGGQSTYGCLSSAALMRSITHALESRVRWWRGEFAVWSIAFAWLSALGDFEGTLICGSGIVDAGWSECGRRWFDARESVYM